MVNILKPKFRYKQFVKVIDGFFKDYKGTILSYEIKGENILYTIELKIDDELQKEVFNEKEISTAYKSLNPFSK